MNRAIPAVTANPGALSVQLSSLSGFAQLASGSAPFKTNSTPLTGNLSFVLRLKGINPYIRFANSYREPSASERYLLRNFTSPATGFSALVVGNPNLNPERGNNLDLGVKVQKQRLSASVGYFRNYIKDLVAFAGPTVATFCVPTTAADTVIVASRACPPFPSGHLVNFNGRINQGRVVISGVEASYEIALPLGTWGSLNPFGSMGWLNGVNISANRFTDAGRINVMNAVYNRSDTPIKLVGNENDVPLGNITPFRGIFGARINDNKGGLFAEYDARYQAQVTRVDPNSLVSGTLTAYGFLRSFDALTKQSIRGGYNWRREGGRFSFTVGVDNLTNRLYFEHFQSAPAPGRAFIFGFTTEFFNLLKK